MNEGSNLVAYVLTSRNSVLSWKDLASSNNPKDTINPQSRSFSPDRKGCELVRLVPCTRFNVLVFHFQFHNLGFLDLLSKNALECDGISCELADTLAQFLDGHLVLVKLEAEVGLIVDEGSLGDIKLDSVFGL